PLARAPPVRVRMGAGVRDRPRPPAACAVVCCAARECCGAPARRGLDGDRRFREVLGMGVADERALMTADEFERAVARTQLRERARRMAYAILVEGVSAGVAAAREGVSRQAAHKAAQAVRRRAKGERASPDAAPPSPSARAARP